MEQMMHVWTLIMKNADLGSNKLRNAVVGTHVVGCLEKLEINLSDKAGKVTHAVSKQMAYI